MNTPSPRIIRQNIRLAVVLVVLAMAALWLRPLRVRGAEPLDTLDQRAAETDAPGEKFVAATGGAYAGATLEVRPEVSVLGDEVKLKNVCRWADADKAAFEPIAEMVMIRLPRGAPFRTVTVRELRDTLQAAGVNLAALHLAGATSCTIARTDVKYDERTALDQWVASKEAGQAKPALIEVPKTLTIDPPLPVTGHTEGVLPAPHNENPAPFPVVPAEPRPEAKPVKTLRTLLLAEAAERLGVPAEDLQAHFNPADDRVLNLAEPMFKFGVSSPRHKMLGDTTWDVTIVAEGASQKATVNAMLRAWQAQAILVRPVPYRQTITADDVVERRTVVDRLIDDPLLAKAQSVGQMASRDLRTGTILTARLVEAPLMVRPGQMVTVIIAQGGIRGRATAKATEQGTLGQTIRVRNEANGSLFDVVLTGAQTAEVAASAPDVAIR